MRPLLVFRKYSLKAATDWPSAPRCETPTKSEMLCVVSEEKEKLPEDSTRELYYTCGVWFVPTGSSSVKIGMARSRFARQNLRKEDAHKSRSVHNFFVCTCNWKYSAVPCLARSVCACVRACVRALCHAFPSGFAPKHHRVSIVAWAGMPLRLSRRWCFPGFCRVVILTVWYGTALPRPSTWNLVS